MGHFDINSVIKNMFQKLKVTERRYLWCNNVFYCMFGYLQSLFEPWPGVNICSTLGSLDFVKTFIGKYFNIYMGNTLKILSETLKYRVYHYNEFNCFEGPI